MFLNNKLKFTDVFFSVAVISLFSFITLSCSKGEKDSAWKNWPWTREETNPSIVTLGWTNMDTAYMPLPKYISVYKSPETLQNRTATAFITVADMSKATFNILGDVSWNDKAQGFGAPTVKTPSQFYAGNKSYVIVNGGLFFWDNSAVSSGFYYSQSLAVRNGKLLAPNQNYYSEDWVNFWYPTVGAFCQMSDGSFKTTWTYYTEAGVNYSYPSPAANDLGKEPLEVPSASFPAGAEEFDARQAIGGVTVLLKNGEIVNSYKEEMLDVSADSPQPRSAIGITSDNKMVIFVCQGREVAGGGSGFTTAEEAAIMKSLGCTDALNLDGGGSSCMLVNGKETITPSDGKERAVLTAVSIN